MKGFLTAALLVAVALAGCTDDSRPAASDGRTTVALCTNFGVIEAKLFDERVPITAQNFVDLAESGYYDGVGFHRIIEGFMMQGGRGEPGVETIPDEFHPDLRHDRAGLFSMANAGPGTGSSQFFITFAPTPWLDDKHSIFGEVTDGMDVVEQVEAEAASPSPGTPRTEVVMQTVLVGGGAATGCPAPEGPREPVPAFECPSGVENTDTEGVAGDVITPGLICITVTDDESLVWARNYGDGQHDITWSLTGLDGGALPEGWVVTFDDEGGTVGAHKSSQEAVHTMMHVTVPEGTNGSFDLELRTGHSVTPVTAHVELVHEEVARAGDSARIGYAGRCAYDGEEFDSGEFPLTLGQGGAITGFDLGLIGMGENESGTIYIPAPLAYGYNGPVCSDDPEGNADLIFDVTVLSH